MRKSLGTVILVLLLGFLIGGLFSNLIGLFLDDGSVAHKLFVNYVDFGLEDMGVNLWVVAVVLTIKFKFNLMSAIGVFIASQLLRWYR